MTPHHLQTALWASQPVLEVLTAATMFKRKLHRTFPVFFTYLIIQVAMFCILFPLKTSGHCLQYFYCYWTSVGISLIYGFKVIYEVFLDVFRPYHALKDLGSMLFKWSALVMLLTAIVIAIASPAQDRSALIETILVTQRGVRVIHCGLILLLLIFSKHLGVSWKQNSFGIALGFGAYAAVELGAFALYSAGREGEALVGLMTSVTYCLSILTWFGYAYLNNVARAEPANLLTTQRWNQTLANVQTPQGNDSLIPMFEGMVDRAFSKTSGQSYLTTEGKESNRIFTGSSLSNSTPLFSPNIFDALPTKF